jgi:TonB family protein
MRRSLCPLLALLLPVLPLSAQTQQTPQTAREALIEMFFGTSANHLEKHLPDETRKAFKKMSGPNGVSLLDEFSMFATMARAGGGKIETFATGPTLLHAEDPDSTIVDITVESDNLAGDEDDIELTLHVTKDDKEQRLPFVPRFTFAMKEEAGIWRLNEISVTVHIPLADPEFLRTIEEQEGKQNEQMAQISLQSIVTAENAYHSSHGTYACSLSELRRVPKNSDSKSVTVNVLSNELAAGKSGGYVFAISACDGMQYKVVGEPDTTNSGEHAYCSDESGTMRSSADGKATTCLSNGEPVHSKAATGLTAYDASGIAVSAPPAADSQPKPQRVRVSQSVMQGMVVSKVPPSYPPDARAARIQGSVVIHAVIDKSGNIGNLTVISGHPLLAQAALDAVKQWKYRPYLLNGNPVEVDTQITVNFSLSNAPPAQ